MTDIREGEVIGVSTGSNEWKVIDSRTGDYFTVPNRPTRQQLIDKVSEYFGYSAFKVIRINEDAREIEISPLDVSGTY